MCWVANVVSICTIPRNTWTTITPTFSLSHSVENENRKQFQSSQCLHEWDSLNMSCQAHHDHLQILLITSSTFIIQIGQIKLTSKSDKGKGCCPVLHVSKLSSSGISFNKCFMVFNLMYPTKHFPVNFLPKPFWSLHHPCIPTIFPQTYLTQHPGRMLINNSPFLCCLWINSYPLFFFNVIFMQVNQRQVNHCFS